MNWVVTVPKTTDWNQYEQEIAMVASGRDVMNYRTRFIPKEMSIGDRCYVVYDGKVRGWMKIVGLEDRTEPWICSTTGIRWPAGKYIQRSGVFYRTDGPDMQGFRGVRKFERLSQVASQDSFE